MQDTNRLLTILRAELAFLEKGGYRRRPRYPWRPNFVFEDSPTCINFNEKQTRQPCTECHLIDFVPPGSREKQYPCRHIHLTEHGESVNSFYEWGTEEELEAALAAWLKRTIRQLESESQSQVQVAP